MWLLRDAASDGTLGPSDIAESVRDAARIAQVLANRQLRRTRHSGVEVIHARRRHHLHNDSGQILELLMSSLDNARQRTARLEERVRELEDEQRQLLDEITRLGAGKED